MNSKKVKQLCKKYLEDRNSSNIGDIIGELVKELSDITGVVRVSEIISKGTINADIEIEACVDPEYLAYELIDRYSDDMVVLKELDNIITHRAKSEIIDIIYNSDVTIYYDEDD